MAKKSKRGKSKSIAKSKSSRLSNPVHAVHEAVPSPASLPQWAIVLIILLAAAVVILALRTGITGAYGAYPGFVKATDITFTPVNSISISAYGYSGRVAAVKAQITGVPFPDLVFKVIVDRSINVTRSVYVVTRQIDATALPVGSMAYNYGGVWQILPARSEALYRYADGTTEQVLNRISLFSSSSVNYSYSVITFDASPSKSNPRDVVVRLNDFVVNYSVIPGNSTLQYYIAANGSNVSRLNVTESRLINYSVNVGRWRIDLDNSQPIDLQGVAYEPLYGSLQPVDVGFVSPSLSDLRAINPTTHAVTIRYAYNIRLR